MWCLCTPYCQVARIYCFLSWAVVFQSNPSQRYGNVKPRPPPSWHSKPLFSAAMFESHSTSHAVIDFSSPGNMVSRITVQWQPQIMYGCSCSVLSGAQCLDAGLLVRSQYASRRSCEQPTRLRFTMGSVCPQQNSKLFRTFHILLHSLQAPSSFPLLNALPCF